jgi:uncharacterized radical SAM superfamily Fe-S cluster-containing enzyme
MACKICESSLSDFVFIDGVEDGLELCPDCKAEMEEYIEEEKGKIVLDKCKTCGHLKEILWVDYKKRGRPEGSTNKPKDPVEVARSKGIATLEAF